MITPEFERAYRRLNTEQKRAVDEIEGPVMVVAGPGTGKTEVLTLRIANILLKTDTKPENILALTFTENATTNMRKRLAAVIGAPAYRVRIQTFHSFCNDILQSYPEYFPHIVSSQPITEVEATALIEEIIREGDFFILKPWGEPMLYVSHIIRKIEELKREGIDPEEFEDLIRSHSVESPRDKETKKVEKMKLERTIEKNKELSVIYREYQEKLKEKKFYDWSDMILEVLKKLQEVKSQKSKVESLKLILQETYQYILVDEHQDTNNAQNKILELLADFHAESPNIFVVGDHKQAIFRFQGASVENFLYFKKLYPKAILIDLFRNYRSAQKILDSAHSIIPSPIPLQGVESDPVARERRGEVSVVAFKNANIERFWISEKIKEITSPQPLSQGKGLDVENPTLGGEHGGVAIIYRSNREAFPIAHALSKAGVAHSIESDEDLLGDKFVKKFIVILEAVHHYGDDIYLAPLLHIEEMGIDPLETYKLIRSAKTHKKSIYEMLQESKDFDSLGEKLKKWLRDLREKDLTQFLEQIFKESGIMEAMIKSRDAEAFLGIERLFEEATRINGRRGKTFADFMDYLEILRTHNLFIKKPKNDSKLGAVRLMTAHRAKGLEFDNVFIVNASEKSFGNGRGREMLPLILAAKNEDSLDDERRLFYVALTRAKKNIFITYHENDEAGKEILPSIFISEIKPELLEKLDTKKFEEKIEKDKSVLFAESKNSRIREIDREFVEELFYKEQFSVTALNNYLDCPWKYFYRNLLRIPYFQEKYLLYGTAMHVAVEKMFSTHLRDSKNVYSKELLLKEFEREIKNSFLNDQEIKEALKKGKESLSAWFEERHKSWILPYKMEQPMYGIKFEGIRLSGKLDKIEFVEEGDAEVFVTDYKTGKLKSRNEIEKGNYKRQLIFYKLLLDLHNEGRLNMTKGIIEFLEPNESGRIKFEEFEITKEEVKDLKNVIKKAAEEITSLAFWNSYCETRDCKYCGYRKLLDK